MDDQLGNLRESALPTIADGDGPQMINGSPNTGSEQPANAKPGSYQNERFERGSSVDSGRGSLNDDCIVKAAAHLPQPDSFPLTRADIEASGNGGPSTADLRVTSRIFGNNQGTNPRDAHPSGSQSFPPLPNCPITEVR